MILGIADRCPVELTMVRGSDIQTGPIEGKLCGAM